MAPEEQWTPVGGAEEPEEVFDMDRLELVDEVTHDVRGALLRRLKHPASVAELADEREVPVTRLYHHVNRLADLGLIRVVATRRSGAVVERRYQAAARGFRVSDRLLAETDPAVLARVTGSLFDVTRLAFQREVERGLLSATRRDEQTMLELGELRLTDARARELVARLAALLEEFRDEEGDPYSVLLAGFPVTP
ncbi:MAG: helix-turn-helix domain-containing protein [Ilumatobacteraceae bacterium]